MIPMLQSVKIDPALTAANMTAGNATGPFFDSKGYDSMTFSVTAGAIAHGHTVIMKVVDSANEGTASADLASHTVTIAAYKKAHIAKVDVELVENDDTLTVEDGTGKSVVFERKASPTANTPEWTTKAHLIARINESFKTIKCTDGGTNDFTIASVDAGRYAVSLTSSEVTRIIPSTVQAMAAIEVPQHSGRRWKAVNIAVTATTPVAAVCIRDYPRNRPVPKPIGTYPA